VKLGTKRLSVFLLSLSMMTPVPTASVIMTPELKEKVMLPKAYAIHKAKKEYKWGTKQHKCLKALWGKESAWNYQAKSPTEDYGIPQRHMSMNTRKQIANFMDNPRIQIDWGLNYIKKRYGSPCQAWKVHQRQNWY